MKTTRLLAVGMLVSDPATAFSGCKIEPAGSEQNATRITASLDQAGMLGLLRRIYSVGLPLFSVRAPEMRALFEEKF